MQNLTAYLLEQLLVIYYDVRNSNKSLRRFFHIVLRWKYAGTSIIETQYIPWTWQEIKKHRYLIFTFP